MSITRADTITCRCGAAQTVEVVESLNAVRHPHLRARVLDRTLHAYPCPACGAISIVEAAFLFVDLERGQLLGVHPAGSRGDADRLGRELVTIFEQRLRDHAPAFVRARARDCLVRICFGAEELREKLVADDAGVDDLALEAAKADLLATTPTLGAAGVVTLVLDEVRDDRLVLIALGLDGRPHAAVLEVERRHVDELAGRHAEILARLPALAAGPHVSLLRLGMVVPGRE